MLNFMNLQMEVQLAVSADSKLELSERIQKRRFRMANNRLLHSSWLWLMIAAILSLFSGGRWAIPLAVWLAPVFLLRFVRMHRPLSGYLTVSLVRAAAGFVTVQGVIPAPAYIFYPIVVILTFVTSLPYLADHLIASRLRSFASTLLFPAAYTTIEYLGSLGPFGSFSSMANTQYGNLPLMQLASVTGLWGITFLITWFAAVVNWAWEHEFAWPRVRAGAMLYGTILAAVLLGGGARLALFPPQATPVRVVGLSASRAASAAVDQQVPMDTMMAVMSGKGTPAQRAIVSAAHARVADDLLNRSQQEARAGAKIIIWPEAGAPVLQEDEAALIQRAATLAKQEGIYLDLGLAVDLTNVPAGAPGAKDESVLIDPTGKILWTYEKTHLVPFLETGQVVPGDGKVPLVDTPYGRLANVICFDLDFPALIRKAGRAGADLMLAPANDWREIDPVHTQAAAFRAIENGFSLVRQDSRGLAMVVDYEGHVLATSDYFTTDQQVMVADVPVHGVRTIYGIIGDAFAWLCMIVLVALTSLAILQSTRFGSATKAPSPLPQPTRDTTI
jgi:apolipoprotein N-acyltransferase